MPQLSLFLEYNLDLSYFAALRINFGFPGVGGGDFHMRSTRGVSQIRVIFSRKNSERVCQLSTKLPERAIISVRNSRRASYFDGTNDKPKEDVNWLITLTYFGLNIHNFRKIF